MSTDAQALTIVEEALGIDDPQARAAHIIARCGDDAILRARVEQLLAHEATDFRLLPTESFIRPLSIIDTIPDRIGPYRVTGEIARGGMGAVVKAERDDGVFAQTVAIKLIRGDLASPRAQARFAEERRILARLSHPGIVRILDGGEAVGRPWLAMDFVDGVAVTEALDARAASREVRLDAVAAVGDALAYAHRNLVIHADIKPSNVLMCSDGGVHLLDFGIARLIVGLDADESGDPYPLTKGYAAPERGVGIAPTVASDVFSLGVLMLGMLGCETPGPDSVCVPGTRLPVGQLDGDLAAIVGKALSEQPEDRYPDVAALMSDIRRHRNFVPVRARDNAGLRYVAGRFVWRHRRGLALTALIGLALVATTVVSTVSYFRAEQARQEADGRFDDARGTARYLLFDLMPKLENTPRALPLRAEMADVAQRYLDRLSSARQASATVRLEAATGLWRLAQHQARAGGPNLNQPDRADANLRKAEAIALTLDGDAAKVLLARIRIDRLWLATMMQGDMVGAARLATTMEQSIASAKALDPTLEPQAQYVLADFKGWQGAFVEEYRIADAALARLASGETRYALIARARLTGNKAEALYYQEKPAAALVLYREGLAVVERAYRNAPDDNYLLLRRAVWRWNVGSTLMDLNRFQEALDILRSSLDDAEKGLAFDPADHEARRNRRISALAVAQALGFLGRTDEALLVMRNVLADDEHLLQASPQNPRIARDLAFDHTVIGEALDHAGRSADACQADRMTMALYDNLGRRGLLAKVDVVKNIAELNARLKRNCASR
jgi:eukaryotic-like serine/threonine-protein kinase